jgi:chemotaxis signal transduction protein
VSVVVRFRTGSGQYAVPVEHARQVCSASGLSPLPGARAGVVGILRNGDDALTVVSVLGSGEDQVLVLDPDERPFGVLVEEVTGVSTIDDAAVGPPPSGQNDDLVTGVIATASGLVFLVDAAALAKRLGR